LSLYETILDQIVVISLDLFGVFTLKTGDGCECINIIPGRTTNQASNFLSGLIAFNINGSSFDVITATFDTFCAVCVNIVVYFFFGWFTIWTITEAIRAFPVFINGIIIVPVTAITEYFFAFRALTFFFATFIHD